MSRRRKGWILFLSIAAALGADKDKRFQAGPASAYPTRQTIQELTIAADPFATEAKTRQAFGKLNPNRYGVLPVLVVMENAGPEALSLETVRVYYITAEGQKIEATPASEVRYATGPKRPDLVPGPLPRLPGASGRRKSPLDVWEIEGRAFVAKMLAPRESASGFFYFQAPHRAGAKLFVSGIRVAATGQELFFFEIPLDAAR
ncbi:MAG: hypothetical protein NZM33_05340 [Bryobacteraceae bacterium]|nr:hypothetical protein [Bryobacteraceae bacterium]